MKTVPSNMGRKCFVRPLAASFFSSKTIFLYLKFFNPSKQNIYVKNSFSCSGWFYHVFGHFGIHYFVNFISFVYLYKRITHIHFCKFFTHCNMTQQFIIQYSVVVLTPLNLLDVYKLMILHSF